MKTPLQEIWGKWPGDESIDEILEALRQTSKVEGTAMQLTRNFSDDEFRCPCCGKEEMSPAFVERLQIARDIADIPFRINSGWRCENRNSDVGGVVDSSHMAGHAVDIRASDSHTRFVIDGALRMVGFRRIGVRKTFIHVDDDVSKPQGVMWLY